MAAKPTGKLSAGSAAKIRAQVSAMTKGCK